MVRSFLRSFSGGEVSPELFGRIDDVRYQTGLALCRNMLTKPHGPARNRPGFEYRATTKVFDTGDASRATRVIPCVFSTGDTAIIELGDGYFRVLVNGTYVVVPAARAYVPNFNFNPGNVTTGAGGTIATSTGLAHGLLLGDPIRFTKGANPGDVLPTPLVEGAVYYAVPTSATAISVSTTADGGTLVNITAVSVGTSKCHFGYVVGDFVSYGGSTWRCLQDPVFASGSISPAPSAYWRLQPVIDGSPRLEVPTSYAAADLFDIRFVQSNDVLTFTHPSYPATEIRRYSDTRWLLAAITFAPSITPPTIAVTPHFGQCLNLLYAGARFGSPQEKNEFQVVASAHHFQVGDTVSFGSTGFPLLNGKQFTISRVGNPTTFNIVTNEGGINPLVDPAAPTTLYCLVTNNDFGGNLRFSWTANLHVGATIAEGTKVMFDAYSGVPVGFNTAINYYVRNYNPATGTFNISQTLAGALEPAAGVSFQCLIRFWGGDSQESGWVQLSTLYYDLTSTYVATSVNANDEESVASAEVSVSNNLFTPGAANVLTITPVTGAASYRLYKKRDGVFGFIGKSTGGDFTDDNIAPDLGVTPPVHDTSLDGTNYPTAVGYFEQRRVFARGQQIWMTRSGTESDLSSSIPLKDDDRISVALAALELNEIRHLVSLDDLLALSSSAEFRVASPDGTQITPTSIMARPQSYVGASKVRPAVVNNSVVYCAARGGHVYSLSYQLASQSFVPESLSLRNTALFDDYTIVDLAQAKSPHPVLWFVSSSGRLLGLTYIPGQEVAGWHWHDTDGVFESVAVVSEGTEDAVYAVVRRTVNGATVRYIERMAPQIPTAIEEAFYVDSGKVFTSTVAGTLSVPHLIGKTVSILADGAVLPSQVVNGSGQITLAKAYSRVVVGLPIAAFLKTLPLSLQIDGFGQGRTKSVTKVHVRVAESAPFWLGPSESSLAPSDAAAPSIRRTGAAETLRTATIAVRAPLEWGDDGQVVLSQPNPLPLTVVGLTIEVATGG